MEYTNIIFEYLVTGKKPQLYDVYDNLLEDCLMMKIKLGDKGIAIDQSLLDIINSMKPSVYVHPSLNLLYNMMNKNDIKKRNNDSIMLVGIIHKLKEIENEYMDTINNHDDLNLNLIPPQFSRVGAPKTPETVEDAKAKKATKDETNQIGQKEFLTTANSLSLGKPQSEQAGVNINERVINNLANISTLGKLQQPRLIIPPNITTLYETVEKLEQALIKTNNLETIYEYIKKIIPRYDTNEITLKEKAQLCMGDFNDEPKPNGTFIPRTGDINNYYEKDIKGDNVVKKGLIIDTPLYDCKNSVDLEKVINAIQIYNLMKTIKGTKNFRLYELPEIMNNLKELSNYFNADTILSIISFNILYNKVKNKPDLLELLNSGNVSKQNENNEYKKKRGEQLEFTNGIKFIPTNTIEQNVEIIIEEYNKIQVTEQKKKYMKAKTKYYKLRNKLQKLKN
jgi:hypothetical protein